MKTDPPFDWHDLFRVIVSRRGGDVERSWTARLMAGGHRAIGAKVIEEAAEVVAAGEEAQGDRSRRIAEESADLMYHLLVLLAFHGVDIVEVERILAERQGRSGLDEKAARRR